MEPLRDRSGEALARGTRERDLERASMEPLRDRSGEDNEEWDGKPLIALQWSRCVIAAESASHWRRRRSGFRFNGAAA